MDMNNSSQIRKEYWDGIIARMLIILLKDLYKNLSHGDNFTKAVEYDDALEKIVGKWKIGIPYTVTKSSQMIQELDNLDDYVVQTMINN